MRDMSSPKTEKNRPRRKYVFSDGYRFFSAQRYVMHTIWQEFLWKAAQLKCLDRDVRRSFLIKLNHQILSVAI